MKSRNAQEPQEKPGTFETKSPNHTHLKRVSGIIRFICVVTVFAGLTFTEKVWAKNTVVLSLFDGFAPALLENTDTPAFDTLKDEGSWSHHLVPEFPSISLTNHTSFITGCRPANHGIISNRFIDPVRGHYNHWSDADWRTGCKAIFETAEEQGLITAALYIASRYSSTNGAQATIINDEKSFKEFPADLERLEHLERLLALPTAERPDLIVIYYNGPDASQHYTGIDTLETVADVKRSDEIVARMMKALASLGNGDTGTLIIGTDHGMTPIKGLVNIGRIMRRHSIDAKVASSGTSSFLYLNNKQDIDGVILSLSGYDAFDAHRKGSFPNYAHLGDSPRVPDVLLTAKPPYFIEDSDLFPNFAHWMGITHIWPDVFEPPITVLHATHGYDPAMPEMHGIFYAWGHGIRKGHNVDSLNIIDVHPTVAALMNIKPGVPIDGTSVSEILLTE